MFNRILRKTCPYHGLEGKINMVIKMICEICGKEGATIRYVNRSYGKGTNLLRHSPDIIPTSLRSNL
jgi:hypothetical protein